MKRNEEKLNFHEWARKYGNEEDKDVFRGSGLPTPQSRKIEKKSYKRYLKYLES